MAVSGSMKFLIDALRCAERDEKSSFGSKDVFLSKGKSYLKVKNRNGEGPVFEFETAYLPGNWPKKLDHMNANVYLQGRLTNLRYEERDMVAKSLEDLCETRDGNKIGKIVVYDGGYRTKNRTTAVSYGQDENDKREGIVASNHESLSSIFSSVHSYARNLGIHRDLYELKPSIPNGFGKGISIKSSSENIVKILSEFARSRRGVTISEVVIGEGQSGKMAVDYENARKMVFPTPAKKDIPR